jgi:predicted DNA repair protein MutK
VRGVPKLLGALSFIGTAAMLWVGGQILLHGMEELGAVAVPHLVHDTAHHLAEGLGFAVPVWEWLFNALGGAIAGIIVGGVIVALFHLIPRKSKTEAVAH